MTQDFKKALKNKVLQNKIKKIEDKICLLKLLGKTEMIEFYEFHLNTIKNS